MKKNRAALLFLWISALSIPLFAAEQPGSEPEFKRTLALGFAYTGGLVRWGFKRTWAVEAHYLFGSADSNDGDVSSDLIGLRGYRHFRVNKALQFFAGPEMGYVTAKSSSLKTRGYFGGAFAGLEYYILSRLSVGFDVGPYYTYLREKSTGISDSGVDFVVNTFLNFYIF